ncbi:hypothetical protein CCP3SC15_3110001 [Gammaproteobacteria bacterium]
MSSTSEQLSAQAQQLQSTIAFFSLGNTRNTRSELPSTHAPLPRPTATMGMGRRPHKNIGVAPITTVPHTQHTGSNKGFALKLDGHHPRGDSDDAGFERY